MADATTSPLPWQQVQWQRVVDQRGAGRLPHALLCQGPQGVGKSRFATALAQLSLCLERGSDGAACGRCRSCVQFKAGAHPDYRVAEPEAGKKVIAVDRVRAVIAWLVQTSHYPVPKVLLIPGAERMNAAAANALLKNLEEPPGDALLILVSDRPGSLLATIRSRCQVLGFGVPALEQTRQWVRERAGDATEDAINSALELAGGAPLLALEALGEGRVDLFRQLLKDLGGVAAGSADPVTTAAAWNKHEPVQVVSWMLAGVQAMIRGDMGGDAVSSSADDTAKRGGPARLFEHLDRLNEALGRIHAGQNPNKELLMESLFIPWQPTNNPRRNRQ